MAPNVELHAFLLSPGEVVIGRPPVEADDSSSDEVQEEDEAQEEAPDEDEEEEAQEAQYVDDGPEDDEVPQEAAPAPRVNAAAVGDDDAYIKYMYRGGLLMFVSTWGLFFAMVVRGVATGSVFYRTT